GGGAHGQRWAGRGDRAARRVHRGRGHAHPDELGARAPGGGPAGRHRAPARSGGAARPPDLRGAGGRCGHMTPDPSGSSPAPGRERQPGEHDVKGHAFRDEEADEPAPAPGKPARRITWRKLVVLPAALAVVLVLTYVWIENVSLDSIA